MFIYSVTVIVDSEIETDWLDWMTRVHIPAVLQTGCFTDCRLHRMVEGGIEKPAYVMQYRSVSMDDYRRYRDSFAAALQKEHSDRFAGQFHASRQILEEITALPRAQ